jgi:hypothetical protein
LVAGTEPTPEWVLVAAEPITDVDTAAADMLVGLDLQLNAAGNQLILAELMDPVKDKVEGYGLYGTIDRRYSYPTIETAVEAFWERGDLAELTTEVVQGCFRERSNLPDWAALV